MPKDKNLSDRLAAFYAASNSASDFIQRPKKEPPKKETPKLKILKPFEGFESEICLLLEQAFNSTKKDLVELENSPERGVWFLPLPKEWAESSVDGGHVFGAIIKIDRTKSQVVLNFKTTKILRHLILPRRWDYCREENTIFTLSANGECRLFPYWEPPPRNKTPPPAWSWSFINPCHDTGDSSYGWNDD